MPFTPIQTFLGGLLLHISTSFLLADTGRVFGVSGIVDGALFGSREPWRWVTLSGLLVGPLLVKAAGLTSFTAGDAVNGWTGVGMARGIVAGLLVGIGSRLGSGCTSGHFLCGVSRGSPRSILATLTFFTSALITANTLPLTLPTTSEPAYMPQYPSFPTSLLLTGITGSIWLFNNAFRSAIAIRRVPSTTTRYLPYFINGLIFSLGLLISGMADPMKVLCFLRPFPLATFDPSLAMIVLGGVVPNAIHWATMEKGKVRFGWEEWTVPNRNDIDWRLILGSAVFGIGWGLAGVCPGPAIVGLGETVASSVMTGQISSIGPVVLTNIVWMSQGMGIGGNI